MLKGGGGEFEHHPAKDIRVHGLHLGQPWEGATGITAPGHMRLAETDAALAALWSGTATDPFATAIVTSTATLALEALGRPDAAALSRALWHRRHCTQAA